MISNCINSNTIRLLPQRKQFVYVQRRMPRSWPLREQSNAPLNNCRWTGRRESYQGPHAPVREHASLTCFSTSLVLAIPCSIGTQAHR